MNHNVITPFKRNSKVTDLRAHLNGPVLLGKLSTHLRAIDNIEKELEDSIKQHSRQEIDANTGESVTIEYTSTTLDKTTVAVYHTRINARKLQIDTLMKMLNKVMPDLKAIETMDDVANATERALRAFAQAASEE